MNKANKLSKYKNKKDLILHTAIEEFAISGYINASTNNIAKTAGVSKGLLFYHYDSKESLFIAAMEYTYGVFEKFSFENPQLYEISDIFDRIIAISKIKYDFYKTYYHMNTILINAYYLPNEVEYQKIHNFSKVYYSKLLPKFFENTDMSMFRTDISKEEAIQIALQFISVTSNMIFGVSQGDFENIDENIDEKMEKLKMYIDYIKHGFYNS